MTPLTPEEARELLLETLTLGLLSGTDVDPIYWQDYRDEAEPVLAELLGEVEALVALVDLPAFLEAGVRAGRLKDLGKWISSCPRHRAWSSDILPLKACPDCGAPMQPVYRTVLPEEGGEG